MGSGDLQMGFQGGPSAKSKNINAKFLSVGGQNLINKGSMVKFL